MKANYASLAITTLSL